MLSETFTFEFDQTTCEIKPQADGRYRVTVVEARFELMLWTVDGGDLYERAIAELAGTRKAARTMVSPLNIKVAQESKRRTLWICERVCYVMSLAAGRLTRASLRA
jgi:hypothetical protein